MMVFEITLRIGPQLAYYSPQLPLQRVYVRPATALLQLINAIRLQQPDPGLDSSEFFICQRQCKCPGCEPTVVAFQSQQMFFIVGFCRLGIFPAAATAILFVGKQHHPDSMTGTITDSLQ